MPKTINVNVDFDTATSTASKSLKDLCDSVNTYTTTTGTGTSTTYHYGNCYMNRCPHLLPCGDCAITMRYCHHGGGTWKPTWIYSPESTCKSEDQYLVFVFIDYLCYNTYEVSYG